MLFKWLGKLLYSLVLYMYIYLLKLLLDYMNVYKFLYKIWLRRFKYNFNIIWFYDIIVNNKRLKCVF